MLTPLHVAVAVVRQGERVLIARRPQHKHQGGLLEFPGGKVEPGESVCQALVRELAEEVAIVADPARMQPLIRIRHDYADKAVLLDVWEVPGFRGQPRGLEGQPVQWMAIAELQDEDFPVANRAIIRALRLPRQWLISAACDDAGWLEQKLKEALTGHDHPGLILRQPNASPAEYRALAGAAIRVCQALNLPLMLHGNAAVLLEFPEAAGVHLSQPALADYQDDPRLQADLAGRGYWLGVSCHSPAELVQACAAGADYALLSPVAATASHPGQSGLGWQRFADWTAAARLPVYALGGMSAADLAQSRAHGGQGIAGIRHWW